MGYLQLKNWSYRAIQLITFHKFLTGASAALGLTTVLGSAIIAPSSTISQIILSAWLCVMVVVVWGIVFLKSRQASVAVAMSGLHDAFHAARDAYYSSTTGDTTNSVKRHIRDSLGSFSAAFGIVTGASCRASIKQVSGAGQDTRNLRVTTFCRFPDTTEPPKVQGDDFISDNTDYRHIWTERERNCYCSNDILTETGYCNSHLTPQMMKEGRVQYRSTIVWPIRKALEEEDHDIWGFLCVDSLRPNVFMIDLDFAIGAAFADALYIVLKEVAKEIDEEETKEDEP
ncbi:hypothetical protein ACFL2Q_01900 [Thermodesulfobacteriota bacterium]